MSDVLEFSTVADVRHELMAIACIIRHGYPLNQAARAWLSKALDAIAEGRDANAALGLNRGKTKYSVYEIQHLRFWVNDLQRQGLTEAEALEVVADHARWGERELSVEGLQQLLKRTKRRWRNNR